MKNESGCPSGVSNANGQRTTKASNVICGGISISLVPFGLKLARLAHSASWFALVLNPDAQYVFTNESWMTRPNPTLAGDILPDRSRATPRESGTRDQTKQPRCEPDKKPYSTLLVRAITRVNNLPIHPLRNAPSQRQGRQQTPSSSTQWLWIFCLFSNGCPNKQCLSQTKQPMNDSRK